MSNTAITAADGFTLRSGAHLPAVGFGTFLIEPAQTAEAVKNAIEAGYRHIDTAEVYGNEAEVGAGIKASGIKREELFVTAKLWPGSENQARSAAEVRAACEASMKRLGVDYLDLYLIHSPQGGKAQRLAQWQALLDLQAAGKIRAAGVSNFAEKHLEEIREAGLAMPLANQIELHPWSQKPGLVKYLRAQNIQPIAYSSLAPLSTWRAGQMSGKSAEAKQEDGLFAKLAAKYGVSEAQLLLHWGIQNGYAVLAKSLNPERMRQNLMIAGFEISAEDMALLAKQDRGDGIAWAGGDPSKAD